MASRTIHHVFTTSAKYFMAIFTRFASFASFFRESPCHSIVKYYNLLFLEDSKFTYLVIRTVRRSFQLQGRYGTVGSVDKIETY